jgi:mRNA interferase MazF
MVTLAYGDIYLAANGRYTSKPRPVIILQNPDLETGDSVIVVPLTSQDNPDIKTRVPISPTPTNGLDRDCFAEVDKLSAIAVAALGPRVGVLETALQHVITNMSIRLITNLRDPR